METILSNNILGYFLPIFSFILVVVILYAVLTKVSIFGDNKRINFMIAFSAGILCLFAGKTLELVNYMTPWIVFILFVLVMAFMIFMFFGLDSQTIWERVGTPNIVWTFFIILILFAIGKVYGQIVPYEGNGGPLTTILFNPRVLGAIAILLISMWSVQQLSGTDLRPKW